ncbi:hypothetical protein HDV05_006758 [Chytridiales sp. JEL 0842]|nr:hypothetical protein HDV05_006758 [Chytridiales sp. JEL 0842]
MNGYPTQNGIMPLQTNLHHKSSKQNLQQQQPNFSQKDMQAFQRLQMSHMAFQQQHSQQLQHQQHHGQFHHPINTVAPPVQSATYQQHQQQSHAFQHLNQINPNVALYNATTAPPSLASLSKSKSTSHLRGSASDSAFFSNLPPPPPVPPSSSSNQNSYIHHHAQGHRISAASTKSSLPPLSPADTIADSLPPNTPTSARFYSRGSFSSGVLNDTSSMIMSPIHESNNYVGPMRRPSGSIGNVGGLAMSRQLSAPQGPHPLSAMGGAAYNQANTNNSNYNSPVNGGRKNSMGGSAPATVGGMHRTSATSLHQQYSTPPASSRPSTSSSRPSSSTSTSVSSSATGSNANVSASSIEDQMKMMDDLHEQIMSGLNLQAGGPTGMMAAEQQDSYFIQHSEQYQLQQQPQQVVYQHQLMQPQQVVMQQMPMVVPTPMPVPVPVPVPQIQQVKPQISMAPAAVEIISGKQYPFPQNQMHHPQPQPQPQPQIQALPSAQIQALPTPQSIPLPKKLQKMFAETPVQRPQPKSFNDVGSQDQVQTLSSPQIQALPSAQIQALPMPQSMPLPKKLQKMFAETPQQKQKAFNDISSNADDSQDETMPKPPRRTRKYSVNQQGVLSSNPSNASLNISPPDTPPPTTGASSSSSNNKPTTSTSSILSKLGPIDPYTSTLQQLLTLPPGLTLMHGPISKPSTPTRLASLLSKSPTWKLHTAILSARILFLFPLVPSLPPSDEGIPFHALPEEIASLPSITSTTPVAHLKLHAGLEVYVAAEGMWVIEIKDVNVKESTFGQNNIFNEGPSSSLASVVGGGAGSGEKSGSATDLSPSLWRLQARNKEEMLMWLDCLKRAISEIKEEEHQRKAGRGRSGSQSQQGNLHQQLMMGEQGFQPLVLPRLNSGSFSSKVEDELKKRKSSDNVHF